MPRHSRRALLEGVGVAVAGGLAGCTSRLPGSGRTETPDHWPDRETDTAAPVRWRLTHEYGAGRPVIADEAVSIGWRSPGKAGGGAISMVEAKSGTIRSHRELPYPLMDQPIGHEGNVYLYTGVRAGQIWDRLQLRKFAPDGTEQWKTDRKEGRINFLDVGGGRAYLGTGSDGISAERDFPLYSVALSDGTWERTGKSGTTSRGYYDDGRLLLDIGSRTVASHDPADGTEQWRTDGMILTDARRRPALANDVGYVRRREGVAALSLRNGNQIWEATLDHSGWAGTVGQETVVVSLFADHVYGLDPTDGTERWRIETEGSNSRPLLADGSVFVSDEQSVHAIDAATGERQWRTDSKEAIRDYGRGSVVTVSSTDSGATIVAREVSDGTERWRYETQSVEGITVGEWHTYASVDGGVVALGTR